MPENNISDQLAILKKSVVCSEKSSVESGAGVSKYQTDENGEQNSEKNSDRPQNGHFLKNTEKNSVENSVSVSKYQTDEIELPTKNSGKNSGLKNLKPFPKGKSGNPTGRPVGSRNYDTIRKEALIQLGKEQGLTPEQIEVLLVSKGIAQALKGDYRFYKDDMDRKHGQAVSRSEIGGLDGDPVKLDLGMQRILEKVYGKNRDKSSD